MEKKLADAIVNGISNVQINLSLLASILTNAPGKVQNELWRLFEYMIEYWSINFDFENFDGDSLEPARKSKIVKAALDKDRGLQ
jgi:hypothetical protein